MSQEVFLSQSEISIANTLSTLVFNDEDTGILSLESVRTDITLESRQSSLAIGGSASLNVTIAPAPINIVIEQYTPEILISGNYLSDSPDANQYLYLIAGEDIPAAVVCRLGTDGKAYIASFDMPIEEAFAVRGISYLPAPEGELCQIQMDGSFSNSNWDLVPGQPLFLVDAGRLSPIPPGRGILIQVGSVIGDRRIQIDIEEPTILLED